MHDWQDDRIFQRACVGMARFGHEVHLVAIKDEDSKESEFISRGVHIHLTPRRQGWKRRWFCSIDVINKAIELNADIYHFHDPDLLPHVNKLKKNCPKSAVIYDIHENYAGRFADWGLPAFLGNWFRRYEIRKINSIDGITVVSESMKGLFKDAKVPVEVTRNSADLHRLKEINFDEKTEDGGAPVIVTSGSHSHARNCLQTVQAIPFTKGPNDIKPIFQFVGRYMGNIKDEMIEQSKKDSTEDQLQLDGMIPWDENFKRIARAFCGCVFYEDNPNNRVGVPNRLFEYMYCGLPVVVSNFPELKAIVDDADCGLIVDSEDPKSIGQALSTLLSDPVRSKQMGENGKEALAKKYGYHVDLEKLNAFYLSLLN